MIFYKAVNKNDLKKDYIPGTCTADPKVAMDWFNRYSSKRKNDKKNRHIKKGEAVIIMFEFNENELMSHEEFQRSGVKEHSRKNCWTSTLKNKAQINTVVEYEVIDESLCVFKKPTAKRKFK